jgi:ankyrin repeat protein
MLAAKKDRKQVLQLLLTRGASVHGKDKRGATVLMMVAYHGHKDVVELLLSRGANIHEKCKFRMTALMRAAFKGHWEVVKLLITKQALIGEKSTDRLAWTGLAMATGAVVRGCCAVVNGVSRVVA